MDLEQTKAFLEVKGPGYEHIKTDLIPDLGVGFVYMDPLPKMCFSTEILTEFVDWQRRMIRYLRESRQTRGHAPVRYLVVGSMVPSVFNLGGDLELFLELINNGDKERLRAYAHLCVENVWNWISDFFDEELTTISVVQGAALGGGLEAALTTDHVICEKDVKLGVPEINFNLFPGMGAYHLLGQRLGPRLAERLISGGKVYRAQELYDLGVVDELAEPGTGIAAAAAFIKNDQPRFNGRQAIRSIKRHAFPITLQSLLDVTDFWVERAFRIPESDLAIMKTLVEAQKKKYRRNRFKLQIATLAKNLELELKSPWHLAQAAWHDLAPRR